MVFGLLGAYTKFPSLLSRSTEKGKILYPYIPRTNCVQISFILTATISRSCKVLENQCFLCFLYFHWVNEMQQPFSVVDKIASMASFWSACGSMLVLCWKLPTPHRSKVICQYFTHLLIFYSYPMKVWWWLTEHYGPDEYGPSKIKANHKEYPTQYHHYIYVYKVKTCGLTFMFFKCLWKY